MNLTQAKPTARMETIPSHLVDPSHGLSCNTPQHLPLSSLLLLVWIPKLLSLVIQVTTLATDYKSVSPCNTSLERTRCSQYASLFLITYTYSSQCQLLNPCYQILYLTIKSCLQATQKRQKHSRKWSSFM